jgi:hypothetical protein
MARKTPNEIVEEAIDEEALKKDAKRDASLRLLQRQLAEIKYKYQYVHKQLVEAERREEFRLDIQEERQREAFKKLASKPGGQSTPIAVMTDWHCEERVDPNTIDGKNEFNLDVAARRIEKAFHKVCEQIERLQSFARMKEMVLPLLGDMIAGYIHEELRESNYLSPTEATLFAQDHICSGIDFLLKHSGASRILIPCCHGNHGRTSPLKVVSTSYKNSFEWGMYHNIERLYRHNPRVAFKIENGIHNWVTIQGHDVRFHHGDHIKYSGGVGGITVPVSKKLSQWNKARVAALDVFGHYHQFVDMWRWVCCGCLVGYNQYAQSVGAEYQEPTQTLIVMSKEYGKVMAIPIYCQ